MSQDLAVARFARMWSDVIAVGVAALADLPADRHLPLSYSDLVASPQVVPGAARRIPGRRSRSEVAGLRCGVIDPRFADCSNRLSSEDLQAVVEGCATGEALLRAHSHRPGTRTEDDRGRASAGRSDTVHTGRRSPFRIWDQCAPSARRRRSRTSSSARQWVTVGEPRRRGKPNGASTNVSAIRPAAVN